MIGSKKASILYILKILLDYSDCEHPLTQNDILNILNKEYDLVLERKSVASSIKLIDDFFDNGCKHYSLNGKKGKNGGVYIDERLFEKSQIQYLIDAVFSSRTLDRGISEEITNKLQKLLPVNNAKDYTIYKTNVINKINLPSIMYSVDVILECIKKNKQIKFEYEGGKISEFHVDPYYLINKNGNYYLLGAKGNYENLTEYRIDKMKNVEEYKKPRRPINSLSDVHNFNIATYINEHPYEFGGSEVVDATIKSISNNYVKYVHDWFGNTKDTMNNDGTAISKVRCDKESLILLMLQYGKYLEVLEPISVRNEIKERITALSEVYK